jgi:nucleoside-diphosphate-sugar epimerase
MIFENLKNRNIVVTGANGLIGSALCRYFELNNFNFLALSRSENKFSYKNYKAIDLSLAGILDDFIDSNSVIFHCAANTSVSASVTDPDFDMRNNFLIFFEVIESVRKSGAALVYISTGSVYDHRILEIKNELSSLYPVSPYSAGKLSAEYYCKVYSETYKLDVKIVRIFSTYGVGINRFVIHDLIKKMALKPPSLKIIGTGEEVRDFIHISDLVRCLCFVAEFGDRKSVV